MQLETHINSINDIDNRSIENEKALHTKTGVCHHDLALPGHQGKDRMVAVSTLSAMWFPRTKTR